MKSISPDCSAFTAVGASHRDPFDAIDLHDLGARPARRLLSRHIILALLIDHLHAEMFEDDYLSIAKMCRTPRIVTSAGSASRSRCHERQAKWWRGRRSSASRPTRC